MNRHILKKTQRNTKYTGTAESGRVTYHQTDVVEWDEKTVLLNTGGWFTVTTKTRMNQAASTFILGFSIHQEKHIWRVNTKSGTFQFSGNTLRLDRVTGEPCNRDPENVPEHKTRGNPRPWLENVSSKYGAPMGRDNEGKVIAGGAYLCTRVPFVDGDYDGGGAYWGGGRGVDPLWCIYSRDLETVHYIRAGSRDAAMLKAVTV